MSPREGFKFLPILLDIHNQNILIIGGGKVALRKVKTLLNYEVFLTIITPECIEELEDLANEHEQINLIKDKFLKEYFDYKEFKLVFAATDDPKINQQISSLAKERGILANVITSVEDNHFLMPAIIHKENMQIAISSSGKSPLMARKVKEAIEENIIPDLNVSTEALAAIRKYVKVNYPDNFSLRKKIYNKVLNSPDLIKQLSKSDSDIETLINSIVRELK